MRVRRRPAVQPRCCPRSVNLTALPIRLSTTWPSRVAIAHDPRTRVRKGRLERQSRACAISRPDRRRPAEDLAPGRAARAISRRPPASPLARSRTSSINRPRCSALAAMRSRSWTRRRERAAVLVRLAQHDVAQARRPRSAGVRSSWLTIDRKRLFRRARLLRHAGGPRGPRDRAARCASRSRGCSRSAAAGSRLDAGKRHEPDRGRHRRAAAAPAAWVGPVAIAQAAGGTGPGSETGAAARSWTRPR